MTTEEQGALDAVMHFLDAYAQGNIDRCMTFIAGSRPILMFGTNDSEVFRTPEEVQTAFARDFENMTNVRWGARRNLHVEAASALASVIVEMSISYESDGKHVATIFRYALTLVKEAAEWKICSGLASVPFTEGTYKFPE